MAKRLKIIILAALLLGGVVFPGGRLWAVGVSVAPSKLEMSARIFGQFSVKMLVTNIAGEPAAYQVSADRWATAVSVRPAEFILEPGASQLVEIIVRPVWPVNLKTDISVVARPLGGSGLTAASGVKVPLEVRVFPAFWPEILPGLAVCLLAIFGVKLWLVNKKNKKKIYE